MFFRLIKLVSVAALILCFFQTVFVLSAEAETILFHVSNQITIHKIKTTSAAIVYQGTYVFSDGSSYDLAGVYIKNTKELNLVAGDASERHGMGVASYLVTRISETKFKGHFWQSFKGNADQTGYGNATLTISTTDPGDFPDWQDSLSQGDGH